MKTRCGQVEILVALNQQLPSTCRAVSLRRATVAEQRVFARNWDVLHYDCNCADGCLDVLMRTVGEISKRVDVEWLPIAPVVRKSLER